MSINLSRGQSRLHGCGIALCLQQHSRPMAVRSRAPSRAASSSPTPHRKTAATGASVSNVGAACLRELMLAKARHKVTDARVAPRCLANTG